MFIIIDKDFKSNAPWFEFYWQSKPTLKYFKTLYNDNTHVVYMLKEEYCRITLHQATLHDFLDFLKTKPAGVDENLYASEPLVLDFIFNMMQENANATEHTWFRDQLLPLWKNYKMKNELI